MSRQCANELLTCSQLESIAAAVTRIPDEVPVAHPEIPLKLTPRQVEHLAL
ncbi:MAG: hypothetical protein RIR52_1943 [Acidobacteriota bacterium]